VLVFSAGVPCSGVLPLARGAVEIGREGPLADLIDDVRMSRRHARVSFDGRAWTVRDLGSRNGTAVDGEELTGERAGEQLRVARAGSSLFLLAADVNPTRGGVRAQGDTLMGPALVRAWQAVARAARCGSTLHLRGESGSGKELAARAFHAAGPRCAGPFAAVNCAAIPEGLAERLLFGARRGAYSGAVEDAAGTIQSAHGGTLFLDEIAELDLAVQAKLLRVLETREVLPLGAARPQPVDIAICSATHKDLRAEVAAGRMREDLYFRVARPEVVVPPLRARLEEVPWLIDRALRRVAAAAGSDPEALRAHPSLVEACLLRPWPGNVRELLAEISAAAQAAIDAGSPQVKAEHLSPTAGVGFGPPSAPAAPEAAGPPDREAIEAALRKAGGNVSSAARALGPHRTQLRRLLSRYGIQ
jgi:DNA-binding NtrC family response regulator